MRTIFSRERRDAEEREREREREQREQRGRGDWGVEFVTRFVLVPTHHDRRFLNVEESEAKPFRRYSCSLSLRAIFHHYHQ